MDEHTTNANASTLISLNLTMNETNGLTSTFGTHRETELTIGKETPSMSVAFYVAPE
jgi:hypothetical protein